MSTLFYCPIAHEIFIKTGTNERVWFETLPFETQKELLPESSYHVGIDTMHEFKEMVPRKGHTEMDTYYYVDCEYSSSLIPSSVNRWQMILSSNGSIISKDIIKGTPGSCGYICNSWYDYDCEDDDE